MRIGTLAVLVAGVGLLTSCKVFDPTIPRVPCSGSSCSVDVAITVQTSPFKCDVDVKPLVLDVSGGPSPKTISWTFAIKVDGTSYSLPSSTPVPIKFEPSADGIITGLALSGNTVSGTYTRPGTAGRRYGYGILLNVVAASACKLDPWVVD